MIQPEYKQNGQNIIAQDLNSSSVCIKMKTLTLELEWWIYLIELPEMNAEKIIIVK